MRGSLSIAELPGEQDITFDHIIEAISYRALRRQEDVLASPW